MGWLRDLMLGAPDPPSSFGELARRLLASPDWPGSTRMRERSLSALFSKLDHGEGLDWLIDRPSVQHLIAETLACSVADVRGAIGAVPSSSGAVSRLVRLRALPRAKTLDLLEESLFPGLPTSVLSPETWKALWWHAPLGTGRSLVGQWLQARALARLEAPSTAQDPRNAPLYWELHAREQVPCSPPSGPFCIAAPFAAPESWSGISVLRTPPISEFLPEVVAWVAQRLPHTAKFDVDWTVRWLSSPDYVGLIDSPGAILELCGLVDELGRDRLTELSPRQLGAEWIAGRVRVALDREDPVAARMTDVGLELLTGMIARTLVESNQPWDVPRDFDTWRSFIPEEFQYDADVEWMEWSLARTTANITPRDIRRAARQMPPGAFRALRALIHLGVLSPTTDRAALLAIRPRWLGNLARAQAERALASGSALTWGEVLLKPGVELLHDAIAARLRAEPTLVIETALEQEASHEAGYASAIETLVVHLGLTHLTTNEVLPDAAIELLEEQLALLVELPDGPPAPRAFPSWIEGSDVFHGLWLLGLLVLSEDRFPKSRRGTYFDVWRAPRLPRHWRSVLDLVAGAIGAHAAEPWVPAAFGVVDRLRRSVASVASDGQGWHALERPGLFVEEAQHGALTWHTVLELGVDAPSIRALEWVTRSLDGVWAEVAGATWRAWVEHGSAGIRDTLLDPSLGVCAAFWPHCPQDALDLLARRREPVAFEQLRAEQWQHCIDNLALGLPSVLEHPLAWHQLPREMVERLLRRSASLADAAWKELWQHHPKEVLETARDLVSREPRIGARIAVQAPPVASAASLEVLALARLPNLDRDSLSQVRQWLHARVRDRDPEWRRAYAMLFEIDQALAVLSQD